MIPSSSSSSSVVDLEIVRFLDLIFMSLKITAAAYSSWAIVCLTFPEKKLLIVPLCKYNRKNVARDLLQEVGGTKFTYY